MTNYKIHSWEQVRITPRAVSYLTSRKQVDTSSNLFGLNLSVPVIAPAMNSLISQDLVNNFERGGGAVVQPRDSLFTAKQYILNASLTTAFGRAKWLYENVSEGPMILAIELNNGYLAELHKVIFQLRKEFGPRLIIWAGAVCTAEGCQLIADAGADAALIGIGTSTVCETTTRTGVGLPSVATLLDCENSPIPKILLGGIRQIGHIPVALALGADLVMVGHLLKNCKDVAHPGDYWGQASATQKGHREYIEGRHDRVDIYDMTSEDLLLDIKFGIQSACSFVGATDINEFTKRVELAYLE